MQLLQPGWPHTTCRICTIVFLHYFASNPQFSISATFSDETTLLRKGMLHTRNVQMWALSNPHGILLRAAQQRFIFKVSPNSWGTVLLGHTSYDLEWTLTSFLSLSRRFFRKFLTISAHMFAWNVFSMC